MKRALGLLGLAAPALLLLALHAPALGYGFVWMDETEIVAGEIVLPPGRWAEAFTRPLHVGSGGAGKVNPYYRPLQILWASALHAAAGPEPRLFHAASLAAGAACVLAFTLLARGLLGSAVLAAFAGAWVAAHPAGTEAWVWIAGIAEPLCALAVVVSVAAALRSGALRTDASGGAAWGWAALSLLALAAGLLVKEKAAVIPALLVAAWASARGSARFARGGWLELDARRLGLLALVQAAVVAVWALVLRRAAVGGGPSWAAPIGGSAASHLASALAA
jgi:hypothetical protein